MKTLNLQKKKKTINAGVLSLYQVLCLWYAIRNAHGFIVTIKHDSKSNKKILINKKKKSIQKAYL